MALFYGSAGGLAKRGFSKFQVDKANWQISSKQIGICSPLLVPLREHARFITGNQF